MTKILTTNLNPDFITRTLKTTGVVLLLALAFGSVYFNFYDALALFSAGVWSMINLIFLSMLIRAAIRPEGIDKVKVLGLMLIKFPILYAAGFFLLITPIFRPIPLIIGFSIVLFVMSMKAIARAIFHLDANGAEHSSQGIA
jgi:hypothetical protein